VVFRDGIASIQLPKDAQITLKWNHEVVPVAPHQEIVGGSVFLSPYQSQSLLEEGSFSLSSSPSAQLLMWNRTSGLKE
jgi:hypothetical protein